MRLLHAPFTFYPDPMGGTEVYVHRLAASLSGMGWENTIIAPGQAGASYDHDGLHVRRFYAPEEPASLRTLYGAVDESLVPQFKQLLNEEDPDVVHLHAYVPSYTPALIMATKDLGIPTVFTYHTPASSCLRGTLLRWGTQPCDGILSTGVCARCQLQSRGLNVLTRNVLAGLPFVVGSLLESMNLRGGAWTALRTSELTHTYHEAAKNLWRDIDVIVALATWIENILLSNHVPPEKIVVCRHGIDSSQANLRNASPPPISPIRLAFLGRMDVTKGPDILIRALIAMPDAPIHLDLYGLLQNESNYSYVDELLLLAGDDPRITFFPAVSNSDVIPLLRNYHLLAVPSQWLETGPLVVLEALAAGIPVLGSRLGGIAEWVEDGKNGLLVTYNQPTAWRQALQKLIDDPQLIAKLTRQVRSPHKMSHVAEQMNALYLKLLKK